MLGECRAGVAELSAIVGVRLVTGVAFRMQQSNCCDRCYVSEASFQSSVSGLAIQKLILKQQFRINGGERYEFSPDAGESVSSWSIKVRTLSSLWQRAVDVTNNVGF